MFKCGLGELMNCLHMSEVPYRKEESGRITGPHKGVLCQYESYT